SCTDGNGGSASTTIELVVFPVNDSPTAINDVRSVIEDTPITLNAVATDPDGDALTFQIVASPTHGMISAFDTATGQLTYTPNLNYNGPDAFTHEVCDSSGACTQGTFTLTVLPVNDPPSTSSIALDVSEDTSVALSLLGTDPDGDILTYRVVTPPAHGTISGFDTTTGQLTYTPNPNYNGPDAFSYEVCDPSGACAQGTITLTVLPVNDPPTATSLVLTGISGEVLSGKLHGTDSDGDLLTYLLFAEPLYGFVENLSPEGQITYVSDSEYTGPVTLVFEVCDPSGACAQGTLQIFLFRFAGGGGQLDDLRVVISEVAWAGGSAGPELKWIELRNLSPSGITLDDWILRWRLKMPKNSLDRVWQTLPLTGLMAEIQTDPQPQWLPFDGTETLQVLDWQADSTADLYLIEWETDETVANVGADLVVDDAVLRKITLHDEGDIVQLLDPWGSVVDTANVLPAGLSGWVAGSLTTRASMERTPVYGEDAPENWHTNLGAIRFGIDASGNPIFGTPRYPNSPRLETLTDRAGAVLIQRSPNTDVVISLPDSEGWSVDPSMWLVIVTQADVLPSPLPVPFSVGHTQDGRIELRMAHEDLPTTRFDVWIRSPSGDVLLAAISSS
ncbi:MAG: tandem-95 repeat protein, partial [Candidatus Atribacteria bacterium]